MGLPTNNDDLIITPVFHGGLGNILYQISVSLSLAKDRNGRAVFYKQGTEKEKDFKPFGGHTLVIKNGLPQNLFEIFPKLDFFDSSIDRDYLLEERQLFVEKNNRAYAPVPGSSSHLIIHGNFFSCHYYFHNLKYIRSFLEPSQEIDQYIKEKYGDILKKRNLAIHLRIGNQNDNFNVVAIPKDWYLRVLKKVRKETLIIVCSDNPQVAREFFKDEMKTRKFFFVENEPMYIDMFLMSKCRILAVHNSSLSAWSALLNKRPKKRIYYHGELFHTVLGAESVPPDWLIPLTVSQLMQKYWEENKDKFYYALSWTKR